MPGMMNTATATGEVTIRDAAEADAEDVSRVGAAAFVAAYAPDLPPVFVESVVAQTYDAAALAGCIAACAAAQDAHFLVAEHAGRLCGFLHYDAFAGRPELHRLYLERACTGRGIGAGLLAELERRLAAGTRYIVLVVGANERARRFYTREGFEEEARHADGLGVYGRQRKLDLGRAVLADVEVVELAKTVTHVRAGTPGRN
jgi:ribosomal protein S18 acetylase RimI-like enzyme